MIGNLAHQIRLTTKDYIFVEKGMNILVVIPEQGTVSPFKLTEQKDIIALRDMLNRAYPVDKPCGT